MSRHSIWAFVHAHSHRRRFSQGSRCQWLKCNWQRPVHLSLVTWVSSMNGKGMECFRSRGSSWMCEKLQPSKWRRMLRSCGRVFETLKSFHTKHLCWTDYEPQEDHWASTRQEVYWYEIFALRKSDGYVSASLWKFDLKLVFSFLGRIRIMTVHISKASSSTYFTTSGRLCWKFRAFSLSSSLPS